MGLKIILSGAVESEEKKQVKSKLYEMRERHIINFDEKDLYDCLEHAAYMDEISMQEKIDEFIKNVDWFICLIPRDTVGGETWKELEGCLRAKKNGSHVTISVFHPKEEGENNEIATDQDDNKKGPKTFRWVWTEANNILGSKKENYWVTFKRGNLDDLKVQVEEQYKKLYDKDKAFWSQHIGYYSKLGSEVNAQEMFFDRERASREYGFVEGENVYIWRKSVDGKMQLAIDSYGLKFLFITGKPGSGKSRAMYEFLHSELIEEQVVVMRYDNVISICQNLQTEIEQQGNDGDFGKTKYCFVCDQINDVFQTARVPKELKLSFLRNVKEQSNCWLIATGTRTSLDNFIEDSEEIISAPDKKWSGGNSDMITIPLISNDSESNEILERLRSRSKIQEGQTIGDFITELNDYKRGIVEEIFNSTKKYKYLCDMLKSIQLTLSYRHITSLLLPVNLLRQYFPKDDAETFKDEVISCLDFLMNKNIIKITNTQKEEEISPFPQDEWETDPLETNVEDEQYPDYIPSYYTFTVNEIVWDYLEKQSMKRPKDTILYDLFNNRKLRVASSKLYESYPHAATLRRIVSRVPHQNEYRDRVGDEERKRMAWEFSMEKLKQLNISDEPQVEILKAFNILIGRSQTVKEIDELLVLMEKNNVEIDDSTIGEMYNFAKKNLSPNTDEFRIFLGKTRLLNDAKRSRDRERGRAWASNDFYRINMEIALLSHINKDYSYNDAFTIISHAFSNVSYTTPDGTMLQKGKESIKAIGKQKSTKECRSLEALMVRLTKLCKTPKEIHQLIKCHQYYEIEPSNYVLHRIGRILKNSQKLKDVISLLLPNLDAKINKAELYETVIVSFVSHMKSFEESIELYKMWHDDLNLGKKHNSRLISICLKNCGTEELQSAIAFIDTLPENAVNGITYNLLISKAGNTDDALYLVKKMRPEDIDEYTLSNCLKCVEIIQQKNYRRDVPKTTPLQIFLYAYEFINHPLLKEKRVREACLQKLYKLTSDRYQEEYVNRIVKEVDFRRLNNLRNNDYINSTRIMCQFRTFSDAFEEIYIPAKQKFDDTNGTILPDLFNNMCAKYHKDVRNQKTGSQPKIENYRIELNEDIKRAIRARRIIQDEFFFLNYHIKFLGEALFNVNGDGMSDIFMKWFSGQEGNYNPANINILSRYLDYIYGMMEISSEEKWCMACIIYGQYKSYFSKWNLHFMPNDAVYIDLLKIVRGCENKEMKLMWIDTELEELDIERTIKLNHYLTNMEDSYKFRYDISHPLKENRQIMNHEKIVKADGYGEIIEVLQQEVSIEGFVAPSILNSSLDKFRKIIRNKNSKAKIFNERNRELKWLKDTTVEERYQEIIEFIKKYNLEESLTLRGVTFLACLTTDNKNRIQLLNKLDQYKDIKESVFGQLSIEPVIGITSINHSRFYFKKWLAIFRDIYGDDKIIADTFSKNGNEIKWNTIRQHFNHELFALTRIHKHSKLPAEEKGEKLYDYMKIHDLTEVLDVVAEILKLYSIQPDYFQMKNFNKLFTFKHVIDLLKLHQSYVNWQEIYEKLKLELD